MAEAIVEASRSITKQHVTKGFVVVRLLWISVMVLIFGLSCTPAADAGVNAPEKAEKFIVFDVPGSSCAPAFAECTTSHDMNPSGAITGSYADANAALHGYLRAPNGKFTKFDAPDSECPSFFSICTFPTGINPAGAITGYYCDAITCHGFLRDRNGAFTPFDPADSAFTQAYGINPHGTITGDFSDINFVAHGFVRTSDGTITTFDAPGAGTVPNQGQGTVGVRINPSGAIAGFYADASSVNHGFVRARDGSITAFDVPDSVETSPTSINPEGTITGSYHDESGALRGFVRARDGMFTTFDVPSALITEPSSINPAGAITGDYQEGGMIHGFLRTTHGTFNKFDPPNSSATFAAVINPAGAIAGSYIDTSALEHGFLRRPLRCQQSGN